MQLGAQNEGCSAREERQGHDGREERKGRMHVVASVAGNSNEKGQRQTDEKGE